MAEVVMASDWRLRLAQDSYRVRAAAMRHAEATAQRVCPIRTGDLVATIVGEADHDTLTGRLSAGNKDVDYAAVVEVGGRPHEIHSKGNWPLSNHRTMLPGDALFYGGRMVHHPGTPAQPYLRPGVLSIGAFQG